MWIHYVIPVFFFTQQKTWKILHQDNKRYDEFWEGVVCMLMTYCPAPGVLFVDVGLVVKELWYDLDPTLSAGIHQWRHVISEENNKEYEYWNFKENKFFTTTFDKHTPIYRFCASNWNKVIHISFFYTMYIYIYTISWNMPNKNQTKRSTSNLNSGMIKPIFSVVYFQITNMTRYFIQIQFHLWNKLKTIQLVKFKQHSQEY